MCEQVSKITLFEQGFYAENNSVKSAAFCPDEWAEKIAYANLEMYDGNHRILELVQRSTTKEGLTTERELLPNFFSNADAIRYAIEKLDAMKAKVFKEM